MNPTLAVLGAGAKAVAVAAKASVLRDMGVDVMVTSFSVRSSGTAIATTRPPVISWIVASMSSG